ncbi:MAG: hypothetical protein IJP79_07250 [Paludibacteraceae bacterium]|nr:hypothetical protein [Paludibacteraceae bacterium]MBQ6963480.1 hypothetical protein [Paludibacteraceae bacterium]MBQ7662506.1 hypothetical protein [Prevotella sp.]MBQ7748269.1 hypothetical protein [Paludibacteraceae bacterium]
MPVESNGNIKEFLAKVTAEEVERLKERLVYNLMAIGEETVNVARNSALKGKDYKDQTGNLRSSVGYVISIDGEIAEMSAFDVVKDGKEGSQSGRDYALQLISEFPEGICLIVVAGMNYAKFVAAKGYDVLDSSQLQAEQLIPQMLKDLGIK